MNELGLVPLKGRAILRIGGEERFGFLQNLVSGDLNAVERGRAIWSALLTPQGKYLFDFFLYPHRDGILLDTESERSADLVRRLTLYRLRAKVTIEDLSDGLQVHALIGTGAGRVMGLPGERGSCRSDNVSVAAVDPRVAELGIRLIGQGAPAVPDAEAAPFNAWDRLRLAHGVPDGTRDLVVDRTTLLEAGFDELGGISFDKGCYVGQELTARMKYRGLLKKRLFPVKTEDADLPEAGTPVMDDKGAEVGEQRSSCGPLGLALLRIERADGPLEVAGRRIGVQRPAWLAAA